MCGGGGDGGAGQARADEQAREARMAEAIAKINTMFGIRPNAIPEPMVNGIPVSTQRQQYEDALKTGPDGRYVNYPGDPDEYDDGSGKFARFDPRNRDRVDLGGELTWANKIKDAIAQLPQSPDNAGMYAQADTNRAARDSLYNKSREDVLGYFRNELDDQKSQADAQMEVDLARRGLSGGSADIAGNRTTADKYNTQLLNLTNRADMSVTDMKAADEKARLDLIARIRGGMDQQSALAGATSALSNNVASSKENAMTTNLGGMFDDVKNLFTLNQVIQGQKQGQAAYKSGSFNGNPSEYRGTVR